MTARFKAKNIEELAKISDGHGDLQYNAPEALSRQALKHILVQAAQSCSSCHVCANETKL